MKIAIVQPAYLPSIGRLAQLSKVDQIVHYDDVAYSPKSWHNRNRIRGPRGPEWLTVPVQHTGEPKLIMDAMIALEPAKWRERQLRLMLDRYAKAQNVAWLDRLARRFDRTAGMLKLADVTISLTHFLMDELGIKTPAIRSSSLGIPLDLDRTARPLAICRALGAKTFICGPTARAYVDESAFNMAGIDIQWFTYDDQPYPQCQPGAFVPQMSAVDYMLNVPSQEWKLP